MTRQRAFATAIVCLLFTASSPVPAQRATPYKLGTFAQGDRNFVGMVLESGVVIDLVRENEAFERRLPSAPRVAMPATMKELIAQYETSAVKNRLAQLAETKSPQAVSQVKTLAPIVPMHMINAARNYTEHAQEMAGRNSEKPAEKPPDSIPGIWVRKPGDTRHNPYVFPKSVGAIIADGEAIQLPPERTQVDWECELAVVIGRTADRVPVERARDYIFGYTLQNDVSDRAERSDGRYGSDWFIGKSHNTFAPLGPHIVPKQFVPNPQALPIKFTLNGTVMQDSSTAGMTHNVDEMVSYVSHVLRLQPGDIISTGSPAGVGTARATPVYMKNGDRSVCTIGSIGTLSNPVVGPASSSR